MLLKLLIALALVYIFIKFSRRKKDFTAAPKRFNENLGHTNTLVPCPKCATYFHAARGVSRLGQTYCSEDCAKREVL